MIHAFQGTSPHGPPAPRLALSTSFLLRRQALVDALWNARDYVAGRVLDLGCNDKPYEHVFAGRYTRWTGLDQPTYRGNPTRSDVFGDGLNAPFRTAAFDTIICTSVLTNLERPDQALAECFRVLVEGGHLLLHGQQYGPLQDHAGDYFRFTSHGLRLLAERAGFDVLHVWPAGGTVALVGAVLSSHIPLLNRANRVSRWLGGLVQTAFYHADRHLFRPGDPIGWLLVCRKPLRARSE